MLSPHRHNLSLINDALDATHDVALIRTLRLLAREAPITPARARHAANEVYGAARSALLTLAGQMREADNDVSPAFACSLAELAVIRLDAGRTDGVERRVYVLAHATAGFLAAAESIVELVERVGGDYALQTSLLARPLPWLDTSPSQYRRLLSPVVQAKMTARFAERGILIK